MKTATLRVVSNDACDGTYDIFLVGVGLRPAVDDTGFTTGTKVIDIDVLANDPNANRANAWIGFPTLAQHGGLAIFSGKVRYIPSGGLPLAGDTFTYQYDNFDPENYDPAARPARCGS